MSFVRRLWTPASAEEWTVEDFYACLFSAVAYFCLAVGSALSLFGFWYGFVILGVGIISAVIMYYIIDPKLKTISEEYEKKQKAYLEDLEKIERWEE